MKILLIVESKHQGNTLKLAKAMEGSAPVTITNIENVKNYDLHDFEIVGFGSGIYYGKHDKKIMKFVSSICDEPAYTFVFSTSGGKNFDKNNRALVDLLKSKNKTVLGTFSCLGLDKYFIMGLFGGTNKGHPGADDLIKAQDFITDIIKKYEMQVTK